MHFSPKWFEKKNGFGQLEYQYGCIDGSRCSFSCSICTMKLSLLTKNVIETCFQDVCNLTVPQSIPLVKFHEAFHKLHSTLSYGVLGNVKDTTSFVLIMASGNVPVGVSRPETWILRKSMSIVLNFALTTRRLCIWKTTAWFRWDTRHWRNLRRRKARSFCCVLLSEAFMVRVSFLLCRSPPSNTPFHSSICAVIKDLAKKTQTKYNILTKGA